MTDTVRPRLGVYFLVNAVFALQVAVGCGVGGFPEPRWLYLILLFAICSSTVIDLDGLNGRNALLAFFMAVYFLSFGAGDLSNVFFGAGSSEFGNVVASIRATTLLPSGPEWVILVGGLIATLGYRATVTILGSGRSAAASREWSPAMMVGIGSLLWVIGTIATYRWYVYIVPDSTSEAFRKGMSTHSVSLVTAYLIGQMCQPLGMLLVTYRWTVSRNLPLAALVFAMVFVQIFIGFVVDTKGLAMLGIILVVTTLVLVNGRLPKTWLVAGLVFIVVIYPYFTAYRVVVHGAGVSRTSAFAHFSDVLAKAIAAKDRVNSGHDRAMTFLERSNVKSSVEVIVERTGNGVAYQAGHTLAPILEAFIPKLVWSEKAWIPAGQLFNKQFHLTESDDVFISPSHLGELYWNFGWPGVVIGMGLIGSILGWVGARFNLAEYRTVTRLLVTMVTVKQLIVVFESSISDCYVVWLRSLAAIGVLHLVFARMPVLARRRRTATEPAASVAVHPLGERIFPNLLT